MLATLEPRDRRLANPQPFRERGLAEAMLGTMADHPHSHGTSERCSLPHPAVLGIGVQVPCKHVRVGRRIGKRHTERDTKPVIAGTGRSSGGTL